MEKLRFRWVKWLAWPHTWLVISPGSSTQPGSVNTCSINKQTVDSGKEWRSLLAQASATLAMLKDILSSPLLQKWGIPSPYWWPQGRMLENNIRSRTRSERRDLTWEWSLVVTIPPSPTGVLGSLQTPGSHFWRCHQTTYQTYLHTPTAYLRADLKLAANMLGFIDI